MHTYIRTSIRLTIYQSSQSESSLLWRSAPTPFIELFYRNITERLASYNYCE